MPFKLSLSDTRMHKHSAELANKFERMPVRLRLPLSLSLCCNIRILLYSFSLVHTHYLSPLRLYYQLPYHTLSLTQGKDTLGILHLYFTHRDRSIHIERA